MRGALAYVFFAVDENVGLSLLGDSRKGSARVV